jgi:hypothetical protein
MKIIISESQLKQIIESEEKKTKLYNIPAEDFLENYQAFIDTYNRKNKYDGIELDGYLYLVGHEVSELEKIFQHVVEVDGDIMLELTNLKSLGRLKKVSGNLNLLGFQIEDLGNLESVRDYLYIFETPIESLGKLKSVGLTFDLRFTRNLETLGNLEYVGSDLRTHGSLISKFSKEEILSKVKIDGEILI